MSIGFMVLILQQSWVNEKKPHILLRNVTKSPQPKVKAIVVENSRSFAARNWVILRKQSPRSAQLWTKGVVDSWHRPLASYFESLIGRLLCIQLIFWISDQVFNICFCLWRAIWPQVETVKIDLPNFMQIFWHFFASKLANKYFKFIQIYLIREC